MKADRHLTGYRGSLIQHFIDQFNLPNLDNPRPDTLRKSITKDAYEMEDSKLEYII